MCRNYAAGNRLQLIQVPTLGLYSVQINQIRLQINQGTNLGVIFGSDKSGTNLGGLYLVFLVREGDGLKVQPTVKG